MHHRTQIKGFLTVLVILALTAITYTSLTYSGGPPAARTNAPGETNCTSCHSGGLHTSGSIWESISFDGNLHAGGYIPDSTYTLTLKMVRPGHSRWGFQLTCLDSNNSKVGTLSAGSSGTSKLSATVSGGMREYITQNSSGNSGTDSISWTFQWQAPSTNMDSVSLYTVVNVTNGNFNTSGDSIVARVFKIGLSPLLPEAEIDADTNVICSGNTVQFYGLSNDTNATYSWSFPTGMPSFSTARNPVVRFNSAGNRIITMTASNAYGTSGAATFNLRIKQTPNAQILTGDQQLCPGDSVELRASFDPTYSYLWSDGQTGNAIFVKDTGTYSVTVSKSGCVATSGTVHVGALAAPLAQLSISGTTNDTACVGSLLALHSNAGPDSFYFYRDQQLLAALDTPYWEVNLNSSSTFGLKVRSSDGCLSELVEQDVFHRSTMAAPQINCAAEGVSTLRYSWDSITYANGMEVSLDGQNWSSSSGTGEHRVEGLQPDQFLSLYARALDGGVCDYSEVQQVGCTTDTCAVPSLSFGYTDRVCEGTEVELTVSGLPVHSSMRIETTASTADSVLRFLPVESRDYRLLVLDSAQMVCGESEHFIAVQVDGRPEIGLMADHTGAGYCVGDSAVLSVNDSFDRVSFVYNGQLVQDGQDIHYTRLTPMDGDSLFVRTFSGVCVDSSTHLFLQVFELPDAGFSFVRNGSNYQFTAADQGLSDYRWDFGDGTTSDQVNPMHDFVDQQNQSVNVQLQVTDANGCSRDTTVTISIPDLSAVWDLALGGIRVYPNPAEEQLHLVYTGAPASFHIKDLQGRQLVDGTLVQGAQIVEIQELPGGFYILEVHVGERRYAGRFLKRQ